MSTRGSGSRRRALTDDERVLWKSFTKAIEPLRERDVPAEEPEDDIFAVPPPPAPRVKRAAKPTPAAPPAPLPRKPDAPPLAPLTRKMKQRVARGRESIDGRLDLHGLTQSEAHGALLRFLRSASMREAKLVLVITGKGGRDGGEGVLRRQVPLWLKLPEFRGYVIGFETAAITHGGEGALYIRVRREK